MGEEDVVVESNHAKNVSASNNVKTKKFSFNKLNKMIKADKKLKEKILKDKLIEIENTEQDMTNKIHMPGIGYKQKQAKNVKNISNTKKVMEEDCKCIKNNTDNWKEKIKETNKEEQIIENVTYMVKVETDQMQRLKNLDNKVESGMKKNSKIGLIKQSDP